MNQHWHVIRDAEGNIIGNGVQGSGWDHDAFIDIYGNGSGNRGPDGFDMNYQIGGNYFIRGWMISWDT